MVEGGGGGGREERGEKGELSFLWDMFISLA
jgi:hypothetical protein